MSRKKQEDQSTWQMPSMYAFVGEYGPFKAKGFDPIANTLVWLYNSGNETNDGECDESYPTPRQRQPRRHAMYPLMDPIQDLLLSSADDASSSRFTTVLVIDIHDMFDSRDEYKAALANETETVELTKKFGKKLLRLFQKLLLYKVAMAATGELCPLLLKMYKALEQIDASYNLEANNTISELWLLHPELSAKYVNTHLVVTAEQQQNGGGGVASQQKKQKKKPHKPKQKQEKQQKRKQHPVQLNLVYRSSASNRISALKPFFSTLGTELLVSDDGKTNNWFSVIAHRRDSVAPPESYSPARCNDLGKMMFVSQMRVEMNKLSKQSERKCSDVTTELLAILDTDKTNEEGAGISDIDWSTCERHVGALLLRGNRCVLVRSVSHEKKWEGMRIPSVVPHKHELGAPHEAAIRAVTEFAEVDASEMRVLPHVLPVALYAPNGQPILVDLYPLYAASEPPGYGDSDYDDGDEEDEDDPYDWYTFPKAMARLDKASVAALQSMALTLVQASTVGLVPSKWGGVFGQELQLRDSKNGILAIA
jgi:hypothetical protein